MEAGRGPLDERAQRGGRAVVPLQKTGEVPARPIAVTGRFGDLRPVQEADTPDTAIPGFHHRGGEHGLVPGEETDSLGTLAERTEPSRRKQAVHRDEERITSEEIADGRPIGNLGFEFEHCARCAFAISPGLGGERRKRPVQQGPVRRRVGGQGPSNCSHPLGIVIQISEHTIEPEQFSLLEIGPPGERTRGCRTPAPGARRHKPAGQYAGHSQSIRAQGAIAVARRARPAIGGCHRIIPRAPRCPGQRLALPQRRLEACSRTSQTHRTIQLDLCGGKSISDEPAGQDFG